MQLDMIRFIQSCANPVLDVVAEFLTMLGEPFTISVIFCGVYWCLDKKLGQYIIFSLCASVCMNGVVKDFFRFERPIGQEGVVSRRVETATGYSFPSGHTQSATSFWTPLIIRTGNIALRMLGAAVIVCVGLSRLYLGVHYPADVLGGMVLGTVIAVSYHFILKHEKYLLGLLICATLAILAFVTGQSEDTFSAAGMAAGLIAGVMFEKRFVNFSTEGAAVKKLLRYALGLVLIGLAYTVPKIFLPDIAAIKACIYAFIVFIAVGAYPLLFKKLRI